MGSDLADATPRSGGVLDGKTRRWDQTGNSEAQPINSSALWGFGEKGSDNDGMGFRGSPQKAHARR